MATTAASQALVAAPPVRRSLIWSLGLGAFGLAFSVTTISVALPPLLHTFTDSGTLIGVAIGAEGLFALTLSPIVGPWSDSFHTPLGRRRPFMLVAIGPMAFCLLLIADSCRTSGRRSLLVLAFYFAYYLYEPPYRGLYPDVLPPSVYGRAQGIQHVLRGIALGIALVGGNFLLKVWQPAPFLVAAFVTSAACGLTILLVREDGGHGHVFEGFGAYIKQSWHIFWQDGDVRTLPDRELRLGGDVRRGPQLRHPLHHRGAARVADASPARSWPRSRAATWSRRISPAGWGTASASRG